MFAFSIKNAFRRKGIAILAVIGIALGCALMTTLLSLSIGMDKKMTDTINEFAGDIMLSQKSMPMGGMLPMSYKDRIKQLDNVKYVLETVTAYIPDTSLDSSSPLGTQVMGISPDRPHRTNEPSSSIIEGHSIEGKYDIIVGAQMINQQQRAGKDMHIGQEIIVPKVRGGEFVTLKIVGIFETGTTIYDMVMVGTNEAAREIMTLPDTVTSSFIVRATNIDAVQELADQIEEMFQDEEYPVDSMIPSDMIGDMTEMMDTFHIFLWAISAVSAAAGGMSIAIVMLMSVMERMPEFGIFKATGWKNSTIILSVIIESTTVSFIGAAIGLGLGFVADTVINHYLGTTIGVIDAILAIQVIGFGILMGVLGGMYPAVKAARVDPIQTLSSL